MSEPAVSKQEERRKRLAKLAQLKEDSSES